MLLGFAAGVALAVAPPVQVCASCPVNDLEEALAEALPGDVFELPDDEYVLDEPLDPDSAVTLRGTNPYGTWLILEGDPGIQVDVDDVILEDLVLSPGDNARAVHAIGVEGLVLRRLTLWTHDFGRVGGGFLLEGSTATIDTCTFTPNHTNGQASAFYATEGSSVTVSGSTFTTQTATGPGGAVLVGDGSTVTFDTCTFVDNASDAAGGAIAMGGQTSTLTLTACRFVDPAAPIGAAVSITAGSLFGSENRVCGANGESAVDADGTRVWWVDNVHRDGDGAAVTVRRGDAVLQDNDVWSHTIGFQLDGGAPSLRNNLVVSSGVGVLADADVTADLDHAGWWDNDEDVSGVPRGAHDVTADPLVPYDPAWPCEADLIRDPTSPLLGAGDPQVEPDIGAFGGPVVTTATTGPTDPTEPTPTTPGPDPTTPTSPTTPEDRSGAAGAAGQAVAGCGCAAGPGPAPLGALLLVGALGRRRRR